MPNCFTFYWKNSTCDLYLERGQEGKPIPYGASNDFLKRGIKAGDYLYIVTVRKGDLYLVGKMEVQDILPWNEAVGKIASPRWQADWVALANPIDTTPMRFGNKIALSLVERLEFLGDEGPQHLVFKEPGALDKQTLRSIRRLTPQAASELDEVLLH